MTKDQVMPNTRARPVREPSVADRAAAMRTSTSESLDLKKELFNLRDIAVLTELAIRQTSEDGLFSAAILRSMQRLSNQACEVCRMVDVDDGESIAGVPG